MSKRVALGCVVVGLVLSACGDQPLGTLGNRSSAWINEPTVPSTQPRVFEAPKPVSAEALLWANDDILNTQFDNTDEFLAEVFARRDGDSFIQSSRTEISFALPGVMFPGMLPPTAEWVSSQLIFDNDGTLSAEPTAAFGVWSAEPYTRSRSVAQMAVLRVATDPDGATSTAEDPGAGCAQLSDQTTQRCEYVSEDSTDTWELRSAAGTTLVWFDSGFRYELFGRDFVTTSSLYEMRQSMVPLSSVPVEG